jgi:Trypsin
LDDVTRIEVMAGVHSIFRGSPQYRAIVQARDIRPHPQYNRDTLINDIGLLFLTRRIPFNNVMQPIALPPRSHENNRFIGEAATIVGWGRFSDGEFPSLCLVAFAT